MTKYFEKTVTRMNESSNNVLSWSKGEEMVGLTNSLFICENGTVIQYVDSDEGDRFLEMVSGLTLEEFNKICDEFFISIENKDLVSMHKALAVFDELDSHPELAKDGMLQRLKRVRESTHEDAYKFEGNEEKDFIIYKGVVYKK